MRTGYRYDEVFAITDEDPELTEKHKSRFMLYILEDFAQDCSCRDGEDITPMAFMEYMADLCTIKPTSAKEVYEGAMAKRLVADWICHLGQCAVGEHERTLHQWVWEKAIEYEDNKSLPEMREYPPYSSPAGEGGSMLSVYAFNPKHEIIRLLKSEGIAGCYSGVDSKPIFAKPFISNLPEISETYNSSLQPINQTPGLTHIQYSFPWFVDTVQLTSHPRSIPRAVRHQLDDCSDIGESLRLSDSAICLQFLVVTYKMLPKIPYFLDEQSLDLSDDTQLLVTTMGPCFSNLQLASAAAQSFAQKKSTIWLKTK